MLSDRREIRAACLEIDPDEFERFIADLWQERQGWATEVTQASRDYGVDVVGQPPGGGPKTALQAKRYGPGNNVSSEAVQQYASLREQYADVGAVTIVTTSGFTSQARDLAEHLDVKLIDGETLAEIVERFDGSEILEWYRAGRPAEWP